MNFDLMLLLPELAMSLLIFLLLLQSLGSGYQRGPAIHKWLGPASLLIFYICAAGFHVSGEMFFSVYKVDKLSQFFKMAIAGGFIITLLNLLHRPPPGCPLMLERERCVDYFMFLAFSALGLMILSSCVELFTIYLALELSSYSLYSVIPLRSNEKQAAEAGIKYILFGAVATAISLYGISYIIASQHTTYIAELARKNWSWAENPMAVIGLSLFLGGMFYKLALFPFHFWCPDVYQGTSNETAAYVATIPKLGAVIILVRLAAIFTPDLEITMILAVLGAISMTFGNLCALAQTDIKRILGFSSVAHAGYIMVGLVAGTAEGLAAAAFYVIAYLFMNLLVFWVVCRVATDRRNLHLEDLNGLWRKAPVLAFSLAVGAFALVGLPPTVGFMGKLFLITAAWNHGFNWLVIILALNSAIAIYYYLSLVRHAYSEEKESPVSAPDTGTFSQIGAGVLAGVVLILGIIPGHVFELTIEAGKELLK